MKSEEIREQEKDLINKLDNVVSQAASQGISVRAGHGLNFDKTKKQCSSPPLPWAGRCWALICWLIDGLQFGAGLSKRGTLGTIEKSYFC